MVLFQNDLILKTKTQYYNISLYSKICNKDLVFHAPILAQKHNERCTFSMIIHSVIEKSVLLNVIRFMFPNADHD